MSARGNGANVNNQNPAPTKKPRKVYTAKKALLKMECTT